MARNAQIREGLLTSKASATLSSLSKVCQLLKSCLSLRYRLRSRCVTVIAHSHLDKFQQLQQKLPLNICGLPLLPIFTELHSEIRNHIYDDSLLSLS
jgi:hypothetical protein